MLSNRRETSRACLLICLFMLSGTQESSGAEQKPLPTVAVPAPAKPDSKDKALYDSDDPTIVKKSRQDICHDQKSGSFAGTIHYRAYRTMKDCLDSGGRRAN